MSHSWHFFHLPTHCGTELRSTKWHIKLLIFYNFSKDKATTAPTTIDPFDSVKIWYFFNYCNPYTPTALHHDKLYSGLSRFRYHYSVKKTLMQMGLFANVETFWLANPSHVMNWNQSEWVNCKFFNVSKSFKVKQEVSRTLVLVLFAKLVSINWSKVHLS